MATWGRVSSLNLGQSCWNCPINGREGQKPLHKLMPLLLTSWPLWERFPQRSLSPLSRHSMTLICLDIYAHQSLAQIVIRYTLLQYSIVAERLVSKIEKGEEESQKKRSSLTRYHWYRVVPVISCCSSGTRILLVVFHQQNCIPGIPFWVA